MEKQVVETIEDFGYKAEIVQDDFSDSPRNWDNVCHVVFNSSVSRHWDINDKNSISSGAVDDLLDFDSVDQMKEYLLEEYGDNLEYLETIRFMEYGGGNCKIKFTDDNPNGIIYITAEQWKKEQIVEHSPAKIAKGEVDTYNQYLEGDIYGYVIEGPNGEYVDSCCGFYGLKYAVEEVKGILESIREEAFRTPIVDRVQ